MSFLYLQGRNINGYWCTSSFLFMQCCRSSLRLLFSYYFLQWICNIFFWYELYQIVEPEMTSLCSRVQGTQMSKNPVSTESISQSHRCLVSLQSQNKKKSSVLTLQNNIFTLLPLKLSFLLLLLMLSLLKYYLITVGKMCNLTDPCY